MLNSYFVRVNFSVYIITYIFIKNNDDNSRNDKIPTYDSRVRLWQSM